MKKILLSLFSVLILISSPALAVDTARTQSDLVTNLFQTGQADGSIDSQDMRDFIVSSAHSRVITEQGVVDYNDLATASTPLSLSAGVALQLENDGAGSFTNLTYIPSGVASLWDTTLDQLDFSDLKLGDKVLLRLDVTLTTLSANTDIDMTMDLAIGGTPYSLDISRESFKSTGTYNITETFPVYMGDANTRDNPGEIMLETDKNATVVVNGWAIFVN